MRILRLLILILLFGFVYACKDKDTTVRSSLSDDFAILLENYSEEGYELDPIKATFAGDYRYNSVFPNVLSETYKEKRKAYYEKYLGALKTINDTQLTATERMSKAVLKWDCMIHLEEMAFQKDLMPIDQMWSRNLEVNQLASGTNAQPFKTVADYKHWLARVDAYLMWLGAAQRNMRKGMATGYVLPKALILKVIPQFENLSKGPVNSHLFYSPIKLLPSTFSKEEKDQLTEAYKVMVTDKIIPAYAQMVTFLKEEYLSAGRDTDGIDGTPLGKDYYQHQIKKYTTTDMTAEAIHTLGLQEVARIRAAMEAVKQEVGFKGDLKAFFNHVRTHKPLKPFTERSQVIAFYDSIHEVMRPQINKLFGKQPKTPFEVRRTEPFREQSAAANYSPGSIDGSRPGIFYTPIPDVEAYNLFDKEDLFLHEAIPGHHFQISLAQESETLPKFRKTLWYSAYGEGWALYTESMGKALGLYKDPYQYFGMLSAEIHRAIRLVVDTGIHTKGWTRAQAIAYSLENEAEAEADIVSEIERYMANPGQALSYKIGQLKLMALRTKAKTALGTAFDIKAFHNQVLETGCIPLQLLEQKIDRWIAIELKK